MRITLLDCDPEVEFGGGSSCPPRLRGFAHGLARAGHDVSVLCASQIADAVAPAIGVRELRLPASVREIDWHFSRTQPELVIERFVPGALEGARAAEEAGVAHLYDITHSALPDAFGGSTAVRGTLPQALERATAVLAASEAAAARVRAVRGLDVSIEVVPCAADETCFDAPSPDTLARIARTLRLGPRERHIGFFGELDRRCGLTVLVEAVARLGWKQLPRIVVVGDGPERNAVLRAAEGARVGLVLCGRVSPPERAACAALCDLVVTAGDEGGVAPQALFEAMAAERAIVAPASAAVRAVVSDGRDACLVTPDDPDALAGALVALYADDRRRALLGAQARRTARARHTWEARAEQVLAFATDTFRRSPSVVIAAAADGNAPRARGASA